MIDVPLYAKDGNTVTVLEIPFNEETVPDIIRHNKKYYVKRELQLKGISYHEAFLYNNKQQTK